MHSTTMASRPVEITIHSALLHGDLILPSAAGGLVIFAHGSGSSRHSPRNRHVAEHLHEAGLGTLLFDLLSQDEEREDQYTGHLRFDIGLLADRLARVTAWAAEDEQTAELAVGYFGASTGGGAALVAAAQQPDRVAAVVSRGGRPDLAGKWLRKVHAPTLLIVGGYDAPVIRLNEQALRELAAPIKRLEIVPGATHLFEEPGTLDQVAVLAAGWFTRHLDHTHRGKEHPTWSDGGT